MKYQIIEEKDLLLIKLFGDTRKNEALHVKRLLSRHLKEKGTRVIVDMKGLKQVDVANLLGVLSGIRKDVGFLRGELRLCSLKPEIMSYFQKNRLDRIFQIHKDQEEARKDVRKDHDE